MSSEHKTQRTRSSSARAAGGPETVDLPDLRILPIKALVPHEYPDEKRVTRLSNRIRAEGYMKNPPVVAPIPGTARFVVLDGANRVCAMERIGSPHVLVQVVDYSSDHVRLLTWHHLITGRQPSAFLEEIRRVEGLVVQPAQMEAASQALSKRSIIAYIALPAGEPGAEASIFTVSDGPGTGPDALRRSTGLLNAMVGTYKHDPQVTIHRVSSETLNDLMHYYDEVSGLVVFPDYKPTDIFSLTEFGLKVPTGITRHIITHRALRVNVDLTMLEGPETLEKKNAWWHEQVKRKLSSNEIRLYQESTYLFDE